MKGCALLKKRVLKIGLAVIVFILGFFMIRQPAPIGSKDTKIIVFGLGKADSIYIENGSQSMLIDTGLKEHRELLIGKLEGLGVEKLDYLILTHPDKDHIGSAGYILARFDVGELIQSTHFKGTNREARIAEAVKLKNIENSQLTEDRVIALGELKISLLAPEEEEYKKDNDYSIVTLIEDGDLRYLFAGDAEKKLLDEVLKRELPPIDLYKVPHHGRINKNSEQMIQKITPKHSIITNYEADGEIDELLKDAGSTIRYAAEEDIEITSNGKELIFE